MLLTSLHGNNGYKGCDSIGPFQTSLCVYCLLVCFFVCLSSGDLLENERKNPRLPDYQYTSKHTPPYVIVVVLLHLVPCIGTVCN